MSVNERTPSADDRAILDVPFHPRPDHRPVAAVGARRTGRGTRAAPRSRPSSSADRTERVGQAAHLVPALGRERAEQVFLVGEVEVEGAVRRARRRARCRRRAPRGSRGRRTPASRRRAAGASSCGPARATRATARVRRLLRATPVRRDDLYASLMIPTTVAEAARRFGDRIAYVTESGWSLTYADLDRISDEVAVGLAREGVGEGDVVAPRAAARRPSTSSPTARRPSSARSPRASTTGSRSANGPRCSSSPGPKLTITRPDRSHRRPAPS